MCAWHLVLLSPILTILDTPRTTNVDGIDPRRIGHRIRWRFWIGTVPYPAESWEPGGNHGKFRRSSGRNLSGVGTIPCSVGGAEGWGQGGVEYPCFREGAERSNERTTYPLRMGTMLRGVMGGDADGWHREEDDDGVGAGWVK